MRTPPCSEPPLAGAHVGRAAVVMAHAVQQSAIREQIWQPLSFETARPTHANNFFEQNNLQ